MGPEFKGCGSRDSAPKGLRPKLTQAAACVTCEGDTRTNVGAGAGRAGTCRQSLWEQKRWQSHFFCFCALLLGRPAATLQHTPAFLCSARPACPAPQSSCRQRARRAASWRHTRPRATPAGLGAAGGASHNRAPLRPGRPRAVIRTHKEEPKEFMTAQAALQESSRDCFKPEMLKQTKKICEREKSH